MKKATLEKTRLFESLVKISPLMGENFNEWQLRYDEIVESEIERRFYEVLPSLGIGRPADKLTAEQAKLVVDKSQEIVQEVSAELRDILMGLKEVNSMLKNLIEGTGNDKSNTLH